MLDLCCGPGVFTVPLARRGHRVTGVDLSPAMLDWARKRSADAGAEVTYVRADAREYEAPQAFDVVLNMFTSFGYFEDPADNARMLRTMHTCLAPGGTLVLDLAGKELLARRVTSQGGAAGRRPDGADRHRAGRVGAAAQRVGAGPGRAGDAGHLDVVRVQRGGAAADGRGAGFARVEVFGGFDGRPYDENAERLVLRAVREA